MSSDTHPQDAVGRLLASIGRKDVAERYLQLFRQEVAGNFARVIVESETLQTSPSEVASAIARLHALDLHPDITVRSAEDKSALQDLLRSDAPLGVLRGWDEVRSMAEREKPQKLIFLRPQGGLRNADGTRASILSIHRDGPQWKARQDLGTGDKKLLIELEELFGQCTHHFTVALTSPADLMRELFTLRGAGTLLRRGSSISTFSTFEDCDEAQLTNLLHSAFGRMPAQHFFHQEVDTIHIAGEYRGAAVVSDTGLGPYLSKFAVDLRAQGEGIGSDLWVSLSSLHSSLYWRSRAQNRIVPWYQDNCDGMQRAGEWVVFWRGTPTASIPELIEDALSRPSDFDEGPS